MAKDVFVEYTQWNTEKLMDASFKFVGLLVTEAGLLTPQQHGELQLRELKNLGKKRVLYNTSTGDFDFKLIGPGIYPTQPEILGNVEIWRVREGIARLEYVPQNPTLPSERSKVFKLLNKVAQEAAERFYLLPITLHPLVLRFPRHVFGEANVLVRGFELS